MYKRMLIMISTICFLSACVPSQKAVQSAIAQTQTSETLVRSIIETGLAQTQIGMNNSESIIKTGIANTQVAWTPTLKPTKTRNPYFLSTITPKHQSFFDPTLQMDCIFWEKVDQSMIGQNICIYGKISSQLWQYNGMYYYFADDGVSLYVIVLKQGSDYFYYPKAEEGICIQENGIIKSYMGILRMEAEGEIHYWSSDLDNCY